LEPMPNTTRLMQQAYKSMNIKPIKTEQDYQEAIKRLEDIFDAAPNTVEGDELEVLGVLIDNFERVHFPIDFPDPIEAIKFRMEQLDYSNQDLAQIIGLKSRVSEILNKKRKLSINMIRKLHDALQIPTDVLVQKY
jgi:HTH-type transcriptional regulator / antitoxin HigA